MTDDSDDSGDSDESDYSGDFDDSYGSDSSDDSDGSDDWWLCEFFYSLLSSLGMSKIAKYLTIER